MYCRNCGKELPNGSIFCPECGTKQNDILDKKNHVLKFIKEHQKLSYAYVAWCLIHFTLFINSSKYESDGFYPWNKPLNSIFTYYWEGMTNEYFHYTFSLFDEYDVYDFSELFFYTILFPFTIFMIVKIFPFIPKYLVYIKKEFIRWKKFSTSKRKQIIHKKEMSNTNNPIDIKQNIVNIKENNGIDPTQDKKLMSQVKEVKYMPLFRRLIGSLIDKTIILIFFVLGYLAISPYGAPRKLGTYTGLLNTSPIAYEYMDKASMNRYNSGVYYEGISKEFQDKERLENKPPHIGSTKELDMNITFSFILFNLIYYIFFESILSASLGKCLLGGKLLNSNNNKAGFGKILYRALCGGLFMIVAVLFFHFQLELSYYGVFILFFLAMDIPVLFKRQSLLDICTGTKYVNDI